MVSVILINYNGCKDTEECVKSLKANDCEKKIIIVDNNSERDRVVYNETISKDTCEIVYLNENVGFAAGNNAGIKCALKYNPDYILLLNNDTVVSNTCLQDFVSKSREYDDSVVITSKIVYFDIFIYKISEYILGIGKKDSNIYNVESQVEYVTGCVMFMSTEIFKRIGYMKEDYFLYYEDADYCCQIRECGVKLIYSPDIVIQHKESRSTNRGSNLYNYYILRNYLKYINTYSDRKVHYLFRKFLLSLKEVLRGRLRYSIWKEAWCDFISGRFGKKLFV